MKSHALKILLLCLHLAHSTTGQLIHDARCFLENGVTAAHLFVSEDLPVGELLGVLGVIGDPEAQGDIKLTLQEHDSPVAISPYSKNLTLVRPLDKEGLEGPASVYINVICERKHAVDPGFVIPVNIRVTDANDNAPEFVNAPYILNISEVTVVGTRVLQGVRAIDADQPGPFSTVQYAVLPGPHSELFVFVNALEGTLVLKKPLDYETLTTFSVGIRAQFIIYEDGTKNGTPERESVCSTQSGIHRLTMYRRLTRSSSRDQRETRLTALKVMCIAHLLRYGLYSGDVNIPVRYGFLPLVYLERQRYFELSTVCVIVQLSQDQGSPPQSSTTTLYVNVIDADDQNPAFEREEYEIRLSRQYNSIVPVHPKAIKAVDRDTGINAPVRYTIQGAPLAFLALNAETAAFRMIRPLHDHEFQSPATIIIKATQVDNPDRYALSTIIVSRADAGTAEMSEQAAVRFLRKDHQASVLENTPVGSVLLTTEVNKMSSNLRFWLAGPAEDLEKFAITNSGELILKNTLDFERRLYHTFLVRVTDNYHNDTSRVNVSVQDVNEWEPRFRHPRYEFHANSVNGGTVIGKLEVADGDRDDKIHLSLRGPDARSFKLQENGDLILRMVEGINGTLARLVAVATDSGRPPRSSMIPVIVHLPNGASSSNAGNSARAAAAWLGSSVLLVAIFGATLGLLGVIILILILYIYHQKRRKTSDSLSSGGSGYRDKSSVRSDLPSTVITTPQALGLGTKIFQGTPAGSLATEPIPSAGRRNILNDCHNHVDDDDDNHDADNDDNDDDDDNDEDDDDDDDHNDDDNNDDVGDNDGQENTDDNANSECHRRRIAVAEKDRNNCQALCSLENSDNDIQLNSTSTKRPYGGFSCTGRGLSLHNKHKVGPIGSSPGLSASSNIPNNNGLLENMNDLSAKRNLIVDLHDVSSHSGIEPSRSVSPTWPAASITPKIKKLSWDDDDRTVDSVLVAPDTKPRSSDQVLNERLNLTVYF